MYLIDKSYFIGKYEISNLNESHSGSSELVSQMIDIEVREFMKLLLGLELFTEFDSFMVDGVLLPSAPQKWLDLVNGIEYDNKKWNGLIYVIGSYPKSLLTNYIWAKHYLEQNRIDGNGNFNVIASKNAVNGNAANQYFRIWNEFVLMVADTTASDFVTLNQFLVDKKDDYPTSNYVIVQFQNRFL